MSTPPKAQTAPLPEKDPAKDLEHFHSLPKKKQVLSRLQEDTDKTSGKAALKVRAKIKAAD